MILLGVTKNLNGRLNKNFKYFKLNLKKVILNISRIFRIVDLNVKKIFFNYFSKFKKNNIIN